MGNNGETDRDCAFCGKTEAEVFLLVAGRDATICDECILRGHSNLEESERIWHQAELREDERFFAAMKDPARYEAPEPLHPTLDRPANAADTACCAFCGKSQDEIAWPISGLNVQICDACVVKAASVVAMPDRPQAFDQNYDEIIDDVRPRVLDLIRMITAEPKQADAEQPPPPPTCTLCGDVAEALVSLPQAAEAPVCVACIWRCSHAVRDTARERGNRQLLELCDRILGDAVQANTERSAEILGKDLAEIGSMESWPLADQREPRCSICGKSRFDIARLVGEPAACICDDCIWISLCILAGPKVDEVSRDQYEPIRDRVETEVGALIRNLFAGNDPAI